jgi:dolichol-phosphate mannosyltransferase
MPQPDSAREWFKGRPFAREVIVRCVRWYFVFKLSSRDLVQRMAERGIVLVHTTVLRIKSRKTMRQIQTYLYRKVAPDPLNLHIPSLPRTNGGTLMQTHTFLVRSQADDGRPTQTAAVRLGIVCPMANERVTAVSFVTDLLRECRAHGFGSVTFFVVVDQKSVDGTRELLGLLQEREPQLCTVWAPENRCVVDAYVRGYREAVAAGCDWILEIDGGGSHRPEDLRAFFEKMAQGYDCVFGSRFCEGGQATETSWKRRFISQGGTWLANLLLGTRLRDMTSGYQLFRRPVLQQVLARGIQSRGHFFQTEVKAYCRKLRVAEVPIHYRAASDSVNSRVLKDAFANLWRLFRLRLSGKL